MSKGLTVCLTDSDGSSEFNWEIESIVPGPDGQYVGVDDTGRPRLILTGGELARLTADGLLGGEGGAD